MAVLRSSRYPVNKEFPGPAVAEAGGIEAPVEAGAVADGASVADGSGVLVAAGDGGRVLFREVVSVTALGVGLVSCVGSGTTGAAHPARNASIPRSASVRVMLLFIT